MQNPTGKGIQCPRCKEKLFSESVHDFKYCGCKYCFIDGGKEYLRYGWGTHDYMGPAPKQINRPRKTKKINKLATRKRVTKTKRPTAS